MPDADEDDAVPSKPFMVAQTRTNFVGELAKQSAKKLAKDEPEQGGAGISKVLRSMDNSTMVKNDRDSTKRLLDGALKDSKENKDHNKDVAFLLR